MRKPNPEEKQLLTQIINNMSLVELWELAMTQDRLMWIQTNMLDPNDLPRTLDEWVEYEIDTLIDGLSSQLKTG
jgi:hypothetical protein